MIIGTPKETKNHEYRVALTPGGTRELAGRGHKVLIQRGAGLGAGIDDREYLEVGATLIDTAEEIFATAEMVVKVKEPIGAEPELLRENQVVFTYLHLAASKDLTERLLNSGCIGIGYETVEDAEGALPLLRPMSEVAGRMAIQSGAHFLERPHGGRGVLLGGVTGVERGQVVILGAGTVGVNACKIAIGMGARVTVLDINAKRLEWLDDLYGNRVNTLFSNRENIERAVASADLLVGAVLLTGRKAPVLVTESMVEKMGARSVIVDVAIDQGGCVETARPTTHEDPVYRIHDVQHCCVSNIPSAVARSSTYALTGVTLPFVSKIADMGVEKALNENRMIRTGLNVYHGELSHPAVAASLDLPLGKSGNNL